MNSRIFARAVETSLALKPSMVTGDRFHVSFAVYKGRFLKVRCNDYNRVHPAHRFGKYANTKGFATEYRASLHSEIKLIVALGAESLDGIEILNIRVNNNNKIALARPCINCARVLRGLNPKRVWYSNENGELAIYE